MCEEYSIHKRIFEHHALFGSHYEIGYKQGELLKNKEREYKFYTSGKFNKKKSKFNNFEEIVEFYDSYCPGLREECKGFADALNVKEENLTIYDFPFSSEKGCSHLAILPALTENNEILVGRSYEWNFRDEDLEFRSTKVNGKYKHLGFSGMIFGRYDGINEKGLCVTYSAGGAWNAKFQKKGLNWSLAVRVLLDNCKNTEEAVNTLTEIPVDWSSNFIIIDSNAHGALVESIDSDYDIVRFDDKSEKQYILATNHFVLPNKIPFNKYNNPWLLPNSEKRREIIEDFIEKNSGKITEKTIEKLLANEFPAGLCCHWQSDGFGTDWSMIINVSQRRVQSCFGPPTHNPWYDFNLKDKVVRSKYEVTFVDKRIT
ncbi:MAG: C45 family autoproteolytic acyltransferase/hydrolase [Candidatus Thorarchaeota archaeon]